MRQRVKKGDLQHLANHYRSMFVVRPFPVLLVGGLAGFCFTSLNAANFILDGGFEPSGGMPDVFPAASPNQRLHFVAGGGSLGAWNYTGYYVDLLGSGYAPIGGTAWNTASEGDQYAYISDSYNIHEGALSQTLSLASGATYRLSFMQADFPNSWDQAPGWVRVTLDLGSSIVQQDFSVGNISGWEAKSLDFALPADPQAMLPVTVTFASRVGNPGIIDGVVLDFVPVPESATIGLLACVSLGGFALWRRRT